jgi:hypothetical protein
MRFIALALLSCALSGLPAQAATGNIGPAAIEIDNDANLYPANAPFNPAGFVNGGIKNSGATADWVKDALANTDAPSLTNSVATGITPGVSGASGGKGHWNGVRIVDGIAGNDKNIFLNGGKENDLSTWNIGPGTTGSSKYDISQAYLANNRQTLFWHGAPGQQRHHGFRLRVQPVSAQSGYATVPAPLDWRRAFHF